LWADQHASPAAPLRSHLSEHWFGPGNEFFLWNWQGQETPFETPFYLHDIFIIYITNIRKIRIAYHKLIIMIRKAKNDELEVVKFKLKAKKIDLNLFLFDFFLND
jgi:hypothetical protein